MIERLKGVQMTQFLRGLLRFATVYAKFEIVGGLILVMLVLGYVAFTANRSDVIPSAPDASSTIQD